ncbi:MAG: acyltransferase family protein [Sphingobium sp.]
MTNGTAVKTAAGREHHWDFLRAVLMLLGVPYHVFLSYRAGQTWIVTSGEGGAAYAWLAEIIHLFRMPVFFIVAGYFAALLLSRRDPGVWFKGRLMRLGIPFVTCLLLLNPLMNFACELSVFPNPRDAWASFLHNSATSGGYWVRHLWFLIVLLYFCALAACAVRFFPALKQARLPQSADQWLARHALPVLLAVAVIVGLWEAVAIELFYMGGLATNFPQQILRLDETIQFAPWFLIGLVLQRTPALLDRLYRLSAPVAAIAVLAAAGSLVGMGRLGPMEGRFIASIAAVSIAQLAIAACKNFADRPHPLVDRMVEASFTIYLFHMPVIIGLVLAGKYVALPVDAKVLLVLLLSLAISWGAWEVIRRSRLLLFLFDGRTMAKSAPIPPSPALYRDKRCDPHPILP